MNASVVVKVRHGLLVSMLDVVRGRRSDSAPHDDAVRTVEGWILGQSCDPHPRVAEAGRAHHSDSIIPDLLQGYEHVLDTLERVSNLASRLIDDGCSKEALPSANPDVAATVAARPRREEVHRVSTLGECG